MAKRENQKLKLLCLYKILSEKTDENHLLKMPEIINELSKYDIEAERKSVYDDIECLRKLGYDIVLVKGKYGGYFLADRLFENAELKVLLDAVIASQFITEKKSAELIKKISSLAANEEGIVLRRELFVANRIKSDNESCFYSVDTVYSAIAQDRCIKFRYLDYSYNKELHYRKDGQFYTVAPLGLTWSDEKYYLIAFEQESGIVKHFRVDKFKELSICESRRELPCEYMNFDLVSYVKTKVGMFSGNIERISLSVPEYKIGAVLDRFGQETFIRPESDGRMKASFRVAVTGQFFGWLSGLGNDVHIVSPEHVRNEFTGYLRKIIETNEV